MIIDPKTSVWLNNNFHPIFGFPKITRFSWSTASKMIEDKGVKFLWQDLESPNTAVDKYKRDNKVFSLMQLKNVSIENF